MINKLDKVTAAAQKLQEMQFQLIEQGLQSDDPQEILKAEAAFAAIKSRSGAAVDRKSYLMDPNDFQSSFGYKDRRTGMSYGLMRSMAQTPIINAIIRTRINQVASFSEPQEDRYSLGYIIEKVPTPNGEEKSTKPTRQEYKEMDFLRNFIENGGQQPSFSSDDFDTFLRKITRDSLIFDQMTFEVVPDGKGYPYEFHAVDSATIRVAESFDDYEYKALREQGMHSASIQGKPVKGYYPSYVQIWQNQIQSEFYPWEMCFGVRNPTTSVRSNGYGISELEELVTTITSLLWGEEYNRRFFKQGSMPKGMFRVSGNVNESRLREFRQFWQSTMQGVWNSWRLPMIQSDQIEYIDLQKTNQEMEFSKWIEFLIKVSCAIYTIDPAEVNFPLSGGADSQSLFEGSNEMRLKHSRDKGLAPLLRFTQKRLNKFLISPFFGGKYRFRFVGVDALTPEKEQEMDVKALTNYEKLDEIRIRRGLPALGPENGGDLILNPTFVQWQTQKAMAATGMDPNASQPQGVDGEEFDAPPEEDNADENPFSKAIEAYLTKLNNS